MSRLALRFDLKLFGVGTGISSLGAAAAQLVSGLTWMGVFLFIVGIPVLVASVLKIETAPVVTYQTWDTERICAAMRRAPDDAVIRIRQMWIPEEHFIGTLRDLYVKDRKRFKLDILLIDPHGENGGTPSPLLAARIKLREISVEQGVREVRATLELLEARLRHLPNDPKTHRRLRADLEIKLYDSMPFGPIYQIGDEVMYVGFFINYATSSDGPMLEIRNTKGNRWWRKFEQDFLDAWSDAEYYVPPAQVDQSMGGVPQPRSGDAVRQPLE